jgi:hypothetical protein
MKLKQCGKYRIRDGGVAVITFIKDGKAYGQFDIEKARPWATGWYMDGENTGGNFHKDLIKRIVPKTKIKALGNVGVANVPPFAEKIEFKTSDCMPVRVCMKCGSTTDLFKPAQCSCQMTIDPKMINPHLK